MILPLQPKSRTSLTCPTRPAMRGLLFAGVAVLTLALAGCPKKTSGVDPNSLGPTGLSNAAPAATLTADPLAVDLGQTVVLSWKTSGATVVTIDGIGQVPASGTQTVSPSNSTNFHLVAKGEGGTTEANARVTVRTGNVTAPAASSTISEADIAARNKANIVTDEAFHAAVQDAFFDYDSFDLRPDAQTNVATAASFLTAHPDLRVLIGGYCDERGSAEYNLALGENRANSARDALVKAGIPTARIRVISYGKEKQFCTEAAESCWQENRRAQFTIDR